MRALRRVAGIALFVAVLVGGWKFGAANDGAVTIDLLAGRIPDVPLWAALAGAFGAGAAVVGALGAYQLAKQGLVARRYRKAVTGLEAEVHQLRTLPLAAEDLGGDDEDRGATPDAVEIPEASERGR